MGMESGARCKACGHSFRIAEGGGMAFHLLRCNRCGETSSITFNELRLIHLKPHSERAFNAAVEKYAGKHSCGGAFKFRAPPRCPRCHSVDLMADPAGEEIVYD